MSTSLKNGKILITDDDVIFNQMIGKKKIPIHSVNNIDSSGNLFIAIIAIITIIGIVRGIKMLQGLKQITIKYGNNDEEHTFWLSQSDLQKFQNSL